MPTPGTDGVRVLPPEVARKIAAGEVVDRPAALVRELVDNAIDAGASLVEVAIAGGGARSAEVIDDGYGMSREDLELCWLPHATSKIRTEEDLQTAETLGFRGEALSAVSAVSRLEILTSRDGREAWKLAVGPGTVGAAAPRIEQAHRARGTTVRALGLFDAVPARKKFLKKDAAEGTLCRQALVDKALAFPEIGFRFVQDGALKLFLPPVATRKERFVAAFLGDRDTPFVHEIAAAGAGFSLSIVVGGSELFRGDRRLQYVIANGRRIQDFALIQALEYGVQGWFPNGTHPIGAVYVDIDPALADFNIHPAKREVRFRDPAAIHHAATEALRDFMRRRGLADAERGGQELAGPALFSIPDRSSQAAETERPYAGGVRPSGTARTPYPDGAGRGAPDGGGSRLAMEALLDARPSFAPLPGRAAAPRAPGQADPTAASTSVRYLGAAFGLFLLAERGDRLYLIDQHAAHERLLYDRYRKKPPAAQELLVPYPFSTDSEAEDEFLAARREKLAELGLVVERDGTESWRLEATPEAWRLSDAETVRAILELRSAGEDFADRWLATLACRSAVKDGDVLDDGTAAALAAAALELPIPRCPHGRPVWMEISRETLFKAVRRIE